MSREPMWFLTTEEYPKRIRVRRSEYDQIIKKVLNDKGFREKGSVVVTYPGKSIGALANGLRSSIKRLNVEDKVMVSVKSSDQGKKVWLIDPKRFLKR